MVQVNGHHVPGGGGGQVCRNRFFRTFQILVTILLHFGGHFDVDTGSPKVETFAETDLKLLINKQKVVSKSPGECILRW